MANDMQTHRGAVVETGQEPSMTSLVSGIVADVQQLIEQQFALLRAEIRRDMTTIRRAAILLATGAIALLVSGVVLLLAIAYGLDAAFIGLPLWAAMAIVGGVVAVAGGATMFAGMKKFSSFSPLPEESAEALKENVQCMIRTPK